MQTKYHSLVAIYLCINEIINCIDSRINHKLAKNKQKVFKIMDSDIEIRKVLEECSEPLTETGIKLFHKQLKLFKTLEYNMRIKKIKCESVIMPSSKILIAKYQNFIIHRWKHVRVHFVILLVHHPRHVIFLL